MPEANQQNWRSDRNIRDQFGRLWLISFERKPDGSGSNMPTGQIIAAGWNDPLATPQIYLMIPVGEFGEPDRNKLVCRHDLWLARQREAERDWKVSLYQKAQKRFPSGFDANTIEEDPYLTSDQGAGPRPWPASDLIVRAMKGDKAMLGQAPLSKEDRRLLGKETLEDMGLASDPVYAEPNPSLAPPPAPPVPVVESAAAVEPKVTYPAFVKMMREQGITNPKEVGAHWRVYQESLETD